MTWHERKRVSYGAANLETTKWEQAKAAKRVQLTNMGQSLSYAEKEKERPERKKKGVKAGRTTAVRYGGVCSTNNRC